MKIETKFNVGEFVYFIDDKQYIEDKQHIEKGKIEKIMISIEDENYSLCNKKGVNTIRITYKLDNYCNYLKQDEIFKDFEDFKNTFWLRFEGANK